MNSKGQALVLFIIIIPLIFISFSIIYEYGNILYNQYKYESISYDIIKSTRDFDEIKELYLKNNYSVDNLIISDGEFLNISNFYYLKSNFGKILNKKYYKIKINYIVKYIDNDIIIEESKEE